LIIISYTTGLSFAQERIGPLAAIIITVFYLLALYLFALPNTPENPSASIYSESLIKTTCQHLLLLVGFDTLIYRKYYDTPPILVGHQFPSRIARAEEAVGLRRRLLGRGQGWPGSGDGKSRTDSGAAAPGRRWTVRHASICFLPWRRDPALDRRPDLQQAVGATLRLWIRRPGRRGRTWRWSASPCCLSLPDWCR
jgi:hypothetical protein